MYAYMYVHVSTYETFSSQKKCPAKSNLAAFGHATLPIENLIEFAEHNECLDNFQSL